MTIHPGLRFPGQPGETFRCGGPGAAAASVRLGGGGCQLLLVEYVAECMSELEGAGRQQGVHPVTGYHWFGEGRLPVPARRAGRLILVDAVPVPAGLVAV